MKGKVKWFDSAKGFGFLTPDDGTKEIFCHHSAITMEGYRTLKENQAVEFEVTLGDRGPRAANVKPA